MGLSKIETTFMPNFWQIPDIRHQMQYHPIFLQFTTDVWHVGCLQVQTVPSLYANQSERLPDEEAVCNGGVGVDPPLLRRTHIHMYTNSTVYVNQDLVCRMFGEASSSIFIGMYLKDGDMYIK